MALLDRKFVHCKNTDSGKVHRSQRLLQVPEIKRLDGFPVQTMPLCRGMDRASPDAPASAHNEGRPRAAAAPPARPAHRTQADHGHAGSPGRGWR
ncbi:hypothetical protein G6F64_014711 [Rhizopus arrhizus]|uniref:Uncharacterized protein n=1 Tax=Rhizopus oryzae TaxID=64495 RepID=A0A9P6WSX1_RHIOR|nr:hypothetical protein G6F64_014711 [Rhizopus arrhizus]